MEKNLYPKVDKTYLTKKAKPKEYFKLIRSTVFKNNKKK